MDKSTIEQNLSVLRDKALAISEDAKSVPPDFYSQLVTIESDIWHDTDRKRYAIEQLNDILTAGFETTENTKKTTKIANTWMLIRRSNDGQRYDFNICSQCNEEDKETKLYFLKECSLPREAMKKLISDCGSVDVAILNIIVVYNKIKDNPDHCPKKFKEDFVLHAVSKTQGSSSSSSSTSMLTHALATP